MRLSEDVSSELGLWAVLHVALAYLLIGEIVTLAVLHRRNFDAWLRRTDIAVRSVDFTCQHGPSQLGR